MDPVALHALFAALERGPVPARDLLDALRTSQPTLSRLTRAAGARVHRIGRARATRYALAREIRALGSSWPVCRIDAAGRARPAGHLHALWPQAWWWKASQPAPVLLDGGHGDGLFEDWPWFLADVWPSGFMGRAFARRHGPALGLSEDPRLWSADDLLVAVLFRGEDLPGNFVVGERAIESAQRGLLSDPQGIPARSRRTRYAALAEEALAGAPAGSSAAGEQPKLTARVLDPDGVRDVIVKFSAPVSTLAGRRWADLLLCEHLAAEHLSAHGLACSNTEWIEAGGRAFLEVVRFDRLGPSGRAGVVSLFALDAQLHGRLDTWSRAADRLRSDGWLGAEDARALHELWWFGRLIANTDMHFGNMSLLLGDARPLRLAPVYDMLPMGFAPSATGELPQRELPIEPPPPEELAPWRRAADLAATYWERVASDGRISAGFRRTIRDRPVAIRRALDRLG